MILEPPQSILRSPQIQLSLYYVPPLSRSSLIVHLSQPRIPSLDHFPAMAHNPNLLSIRRLPTLFHLSTHAYNTIPAFLLWCSDSSRLDFRVLTFGFVAGVVFGLQSLIFIILGMSRLDVWISNFKFHSLLAERHTDLNRIIARYLLCWFRPQKRLLTPITTRRCRVIDGRPSGKLRPSVV